MGLFGGGKPKKESKAPAKKAPRGKGATPKTADVGKNIQSINDNAVVAEEESIPSQTVTQLASDKTSAYSSFETNTHSEYASTQRKRAADQGTLSDLPHYDFTPGQLYHDESGDYYYDEYGKRYEADAVFEAPEIPDEFFGNVQQGTPSARQEVGQRNIDPNNNVAARGDSYAFSVPEEDAESNTFDEPYSSSGDSSPQQQQPQQQLQPQQKRGFGRRSGSKKFEHAEGVETISIKNAPHLENPYEDGARPINEAISNDTAQEEDFPTIAGTIASLVDSSKSADEITKTLMGYLNLTLASEGVDSLIKLLGTDNIYTPLLATALLYNQQSKPIDPVSRRELWDIKPEVIVEEKVVYKRDPKARIDGEKGFWIPLSENQTQLPSLIFEKLSASHEEANREAASRRVDYSSLNY